jgi:hypothetical protein
MVFYDVLGSARMRLDNKRQRVVEEIVMLAIWAMAIVITILWVLTLWRLVRMLVQAVAHA